MYLCRCSILSFDSAFFRTAQSANPSPEKLSSFLSQMLFLWFDPTVWKARKRTVTLDDLWDLNREDRYEPLLCLEIHSTLL